MDTREKILHESLELFSKKGYDNVGVQEICDNSSITKPTLYHYFGSKSGLLAEIMSENYGNLRKIITASTEYSGDLPLTINKTVRAYFGFAKTNPGFYRIMISAFSAPVDSDMYRNSQSLMLNQYEIMERLFLSASKDHGNMKNKHKPLAATFLGHINTYISLWLNNFKELDEELVFSASHQFMHGIYS